MIVYISIGNSDDKLSQKEWAAFAGHVRGWVREYADTIHGEWTSLPWAPWQNAAWCADIADEQAEGCKQALKMCAAMYRQDSIAWAEVTATEFLEATK